MLFCREVLRPPPQCPPVNVHPTASDWVQIKKLFFILLISIFMFFLHIILPCEIASFIFIVILPCEIAIVPLKS